MTKVAVVIGTWYEGDELSQPQLCVRVVLPPQKNDPIESPLEIGNALDDYKSIKAVQKFIDKWSAYAQRHGFGFEIDPALDEIEIDKNWKVLWCEWLDPK